MEIETHATLILAYLEKNLSEIMEKLSNNMKNRFH